MLASSRGAKGLVLLFVVTIVLGGQYWLRGQYSRPITGQSATPTDPIHPPADPIYSEATAISRAIDSLPTGIVVTGSVAKLTRKLNATRWLKGPMASEWGTERAEIMAESTPITANDDDLPYWVVGLKCESITVEQALNTIGVEDTRAVEGAFFFFDASSGTRPVTGALDTETWTTFDSLLGLPGESIPITPMKPVVLVFDSPAQPTETLSIEDYATINALDTEAAAPAKAALAAAVASKTTLVAPQVFHDYDKYPTFGFGSGNSPKDIEEKERVFRAAGTPVEIKKLAALDLWEASQDNDEYFEYLHQVAADAIAFCANIPPVFDASNTITDEFKTWASTHNMSAGEAVIGVILKKVGDVIILASLGDQRASKLFEKGLLSPNINIRLSAADGLAYIGDPSAIPLIVTATEGTNDKSGFANSLAYFDDPLATAKIEEWVTDPAVLQGMRDWVAYNKSIRNRNK